MTSALSLAPVLPDPVSFHGDTLFVLFHEGRHWVVLRPLCEHFGLDQSSQLTKLKAAPWACVAIITTQLPDETQARPMACVELPGLALWLASINPGKVALSLREPLVRYQREAMDVLYKHFFGPRAGQSLAPVEARLEAIERKLDALPGQFADALERGLARGIEAGMRALAARDDLPALSEPPAAAKAVAAVAAVVPDDPSRPYTVRERDQILGALMTTRNNRVQAAQMLGIPRRTFYRRLRAYGIS